MIGLVGNPDIIDAKEVALILKINRVTVTKWAREGKIPGRRIGYVYRFSRKEIEQLLPGTVESSPRGASEQPQQATPLQAGTY